MESLPIFIKSVILTIIMAVAGILATFCIAFEAHDAAIKGAGMPWGMVFALGGAIIVVAFLVCLAARALIVRPLHNIRTAMERLSRGDMSTVVTGLGRGDDLGDIARIAEIYRKKNIDRLNLENSVNQTQQQAEAERVRNDSARAEMAVEQSRVVNALADGLEKLAAGDLMFRISDRFSSDYEGLRLNFNKAMETLQETVRHISQNAANVRASMGELTQSADDLSRRTEQQAASLEQTAAALDQITSTVKKASEGADEARGVANEAKDDAERSGIVVEKTVTAIGEIEASSKQISNIIGVIDEIAFQTNLLALNAGVEAARAGEAGRGFAVVATEVRALAQRSADAAKEIKALIATSGAQVENGVRLVNETGKALGRIVGQVARLDHLVSDIASSSKEQATALAEVNGAINQMDQVTQQNAAMVEESTAASYALAGDAEELGRLAGRFRTGADAPKPAAKPAQPVNASATKVLDKQPKRLSSSAFSESVKDEKLLKPMKPSSLKVKPNDAVPKKSVSQATRKFLAPADADDGDWNEF